MKSIEDSNKIIDREDNFILISYKGLLAIRNLHCKSITGGKIYWTKVDSCGCNIAFPQRLMTKRNKVNNVLRKYGL